MKTEKEIKSILENTLNNYNKPFNNDDCFDPFLEGFESEEEIKTIMAIPDRIKHLLSIAAKLNTLDWVLRGESFLFDSEELIIRKEGEIKGLEANLNFEKRLLNSWIERSKEIYQFARGGECRETKKVSE